jgi:ribosomal protein S14|tara:strand:- start:8 stop:319 length:312 start_codon:yes stop_codon:yes gene_type:complete
MKKNINNQLKLSNLFSVNEEERKIFKLMTMNSILGSSTKDQLAKTFGKLVESDLISGNGISSIRRVCLVSGRGRGLVKSFKVSRIKFKESFNSGLISGSRKSS